MLDRLFVSYPYTSLTASLFEEQQLKHSAQVLHHAIEEIGL